MIAELIQKMQELAASSANYNYQVIRIQESEKNGADIMASYDCSKSDAQNIEGMLSTKFNLGHNPTTIIIAIKRIPK